MIYEAVSVPDLTAADGVKFIQFETREGPL